MISPATVSASSFTQVPTATLHLGSGMDNGAAASLRWQQDLPVQSTMSVKRARQDIPSLVSPLWSSRSTSHLRPFLQDDSGSVPREALAPRPLGTTHVVRPCVQGPTWVNHQVAWSNSSAVPGVTHSVSVAKIVHHLASCDRVLWWPCHPEVEATRKLVPPRRPGAHPAVAQVLHVSDFPRASSSEVSRSCRCRCVSAWCLRHPQQSPGLH